MAGDCMPNWRNCAIAFAACALLPVTALAQATSAGTEAIRAAEEKKIASGFQAYSLAVEEDRTRWFGYLEQGDTDYLGIVNGLAAAPGITAPVAEIMLHCPPHGGRVSTLSFGYQQPLPFESKPPFEIALRIGTETIAMTVAEAEGESHSVRFTTEMRQTRDVLAKVADALLQEDVETVELVHLASGKSLGISIKGLDRQPVRTFQTNCLGAG